MEGSSRRSAAGGPSEAPAVNSASVDWRSQLPPDARQRIVNKIMDTLKRHLPIAVPEGRLKKIAVRFEEKIYTAATSQLDYLRKISLKMLSMETKTQSNNQPLSNPGVGSQNPADSATSLGMEPQVGTQGLAMPLVNQSRARQPLLSQNLQNNTVSGALQGSSGLPPGMPSISGLNQSTITNVGQTSNLQNMSAVSQNSVNNPAGQGASQNMYANAQRQSQGRPQQFPLMSQQQQQPQIYRKQYQQQLLKQKIQQQQQSLLQSNQLHSSQQPLMQIPSSIQNGQSGIQQTKFSIMQSTQQSNLQQSQQNTIQHPMPSTMQQHSQTIGRQQQAHPTLHQTSSLQQQSTTVSQQIVLQPQQQLIGQTSNMTNMQQNQLFGQQNNVPDMQQQQQRLTGPQNNLMSMQQPQQLLNPQTMSLHQQQQLGQQNNMSGLQQQQQKQQQQILGPQSGVSTMQQHQRSMHMMQQSKTVTQQQNQQPPLTVLQSQGQQSQHQSSQQQLMSQIQSQSPQLQQQLAMQQQSNSMQREMQQRLQSSGTIQPQNTLEQQKQFIQSQRGLPVVSSSTSVDSTAQTGQAGALDWQEEVYQKIQSSSDQALKSFVGDIESVVSMVDRIAGSAPGNGSRAAVGEDLVAMTKCRLQARNFISQDGSAMTKKMKRHTNAMPLNAVSLAGSVNDSFKQSYGLDTPELDSTATSSAKRQKIEVSHALLEEIGEINQKLIDTVVSITDEEVDSVVAMGEGTVVKLSFSAISLSPNLKSQLVSLHMYTIMPLRLLVPTNYPKCSPVLLDKLPVEESKQTEDLSVEAQAMFNRSLRCLSQPMSLGEMARTWDICTRKVIVEYAQQNGGGSFSSRYGSWESCVIA